jgi:hypothetical protein
MKQLASKVFEFFSMLPPFVLFIMRVLPVHYIVLDSTEPLSCFFQFLQIKTGCISCLLLTQVLQTGC